MLALVCLSPKIVATEISPLFGIGQDNFSFQIQGLSENTPEVQYEPNIPGLSRVGLSAYGFGISWSFRNSVGQLKETQGKTNFTDFQLGYHNDRFGLDGFFQTYKGFYVLNSADFSGSSDTPFLLPDITVKHYAVTGRLARDNQGGFVLSDLLTQTEQIKKTAGTYYLIGGIRFYGFESIDTMLPPTLLGLNSDVESIREMQVHIGNLGVGAGKYWVSDSNFFLGGCLDLVGSFGLYKYTYSPTRVSDGSYGTISYNIKFGAGYSGEHFRSGASINIETSSLKAAQNSFIRASSNQVLAYVRWAFK